MKDLDAIDLIDVRLLTTTGERQISVRQGIRSIAISTNKTMSRSSCLSHMATAIQKDLHFRCIACQIHRPHLAVIERSVPAAGLRLAFSALVSRTQMLYLSHDSKVLNYCSHEPQTEN